MKKTRKKREYKTGINALEEREGGRGKNSRKGEMRKTEKSRR